MVAEPVVFSSGNYLSEQDRKHKLQWSAYERAQTPAATLYGRKR